MKHFNFNGSFGDLRQFGIHFLTGEACAIGTRLLCDLTPQGVATIEAAFGLPVRVGKEPGHRYPSFAENWNGGTTADPHVASIMLGRGMVRDIAIIGMFEVHKCDTVLLFADGRGWRTERDVEGVKLEDGENFSALQDYVAEYSAEYDDEGRVTKKASCCYERSITPINHPRRGLQCVHAMTGRSL